MTFHRRTYLALAALLTVGTALALATDQATLADKETKETREVKKVVWLTDFDKAAKEAAKTKKPIMIDFYADWCGWCVKLDKEVYTNGKVIEASKKFVNVKIDTDKSESIARKYGIRGLPTILFLSSDSKEVSRVVGYRPADEFLKEMNSVLAKTARKK